MQGVTMKTELVQNDVLGTLDRELYVDLDFLGFGVRYFGPFHEQGIKLEFPTLSIKRLRAAIGFSKAENPGIGSSGEGAQKRVERGTCSRVRSATDGP